MITVTGPDRFGWLHSLTTQYLEGLEPGRGVTTLVLSPHGHIEHVLYGVDDGEIFWAHTEAGSAAGTGRLAGPMRFLMRVEVSDRSVTTPWCGPQADLGDGSAWFGQVPTRGWAGLFVPRDRACIGSCNRGPQAGIWALEARRIAAGVPRIGLDTDHRTIPNEIGLLGVAVHLGQGLLPGSGNRRPGPQPRTAATPTGAAASGRQRQCIADSRRTARAGWAGCRLRWWLGAALRAWPYRPRTDQAHDTRECSTDRRWHCRSPGAAGRSRNWSSRTSLIASRAERAKASRAIKLASGAEFGEGLLAGADFAHPLTATEHRRAGMIV